MFFCRITQGVNTLDDEKVRYWDRIGRDWAQNHRQRLWRSHSDAVNSRLLIRWLPPEKVDRLLKTDLFDELVSEGIYPLLAGRANHIFCIDTSLFALRTVQGWPAGPRKIGADVRSLPFVNDAFDVIVSNSTLDHFGSADEIASSLCELHRVLRSGGHLIITLDNPVNPLVFLRNRLPFPFLYKVGIVPYYVGVTLTPSQLKNFLNKAGFEIIETEFTLHCLRILAVRVSDWIEKRFGPSGQKRYLRFLIAFECLSRWPTRFFTGNFTAVKAMKRSSPNE
jgi:SAM-dependent methyltransferase